MPNEKFTVSGRDLVGKVQDLINEGNVRRVRLIHDDKVLIDIRSDGPCFETAGYDDARERDKRADEAESVRLMYVAATRARDDLVLSLFRPVKGRCAAQTLEELASQDGSLWQKLDLAETRKPVEQPGSPPDGRREDLSFDRKEWQAERERVIRSSSRPAAWAVTALTGIAKDEAQAGLEPHRRGRGGTSLGRVVHSVLQSVDLATGAGLEDISRARRRPRRYPVAGRM